MNDFFTLDLLRDMAGIEIKGLHVEHSPHSGVKVQIVVDTPEQVRAVAARLGAEVGEIRESETATRYSAYRHTMATLTRPGLRVNVGSCERVAAERPKAVSR